MTTSTLDLRGKRALVMGLGVNGGGLGVTHFLLQHGAEVTVTDLRSAEVLEPTLAALAGLPVRYVLGSHHEADFRQADLVIRNPAVPRESRWLQIARAAGAAIEMEMTLFFRLCPGPIIGITGTRGKTTTTLLVGEMLRRQFPDTVVAGNLRVSALEQLARITPQTPVVLELSSWQLEGLGEAQLSPQYACVTNMSPDHLDRYRSMDEYALAKRQIVEHQRATDIAVLNQGDPLVSQFAQHTRAQIIPFGEASAAWEPQGPAVRVYGDTVETTIGGGAWQTVCTAAELQLPGHHSLLNVAAASALALSYGVALDDVRAALRAFPGVPDRMEVVRELGGVCFVNDTTATTPTAAIAALRAFTAPVILIAGGADKKLPWTGFAAVVAEHAKAVVLLAGSGTTRLLDELAPVKQRLPISLPFDSLRAAVESAQQLAKPGEVVLLSPACASFGMFINEFDRGEQFRQIVQGLT
ncbi:MAG: UDP-N-acetylmuramoyl-L-alanine--D-glutamate ligase [Herpetosiphonaceae bacterium]|nr:UDP-N-acetylmuramoyl-L-alanine--D-glutamate ligase [Herpetosiphonaceae bacterium]